jgi:apolipoprotein D and lipocalin family protein
MNSRKLIYLGLALVGVFSVVRAAFGEVLLESVPKVDLSRYTGRWFEIAKYPNRFERKCDSNATATYSLRSDGKISVVNTCKTREEQQLRRGKRLRWRAEERHCMVK